MYIDKDGKEYKYIHLIKNHSHFLDGWYFEDETGRIDTNGPFETLENALEEFNFYVRYNLNGNSVSEYLHMKINSLGNQYIEDLLSDPTLNQSYYCNTLVKDLMLTAYTKGYMENYKERLLKNV